MTDRERDIKRIWGLDEDEELDEERLQDMVLDLLMEQASNINGDGRDAQLEFLLDNLGESEQHEYSAGAGSKVFTVEIQLGNAAMSSAEHVIDALARVQHQLHERRGEELKPFHSRSIMDINGNTVGTWNIGMKADD